MAEAARIIHEAASSRAERLRPLTTEHNRGFGLLNAAIRVHHAPMARKLPSRYEIDETGGAIVCRDWPSIQLHVERGLTIDEDQRDKYPDQAIFLDGVFTGPAFLDNERRQYSLDHHAGCVRAFTLATCEQACVMLMQGLPLWEGEWHVYVNEPDLDAVLAAWIILNHHALVHDDYAMLRKVMPLVRVEGVIDTYGLDKALLSGLPRRIYEAHKKRIDKLRADERNLREHGKWGDVDVLEFTRDQLGKLDIQLFPRGQPRTAGIQSTDELVLPSRKLAVLVQSHVGIYEIEEQLKVKHKNELGVIVHDAGDDRMTLRLVDAFLPKNLNEVYPRLNEVDPRATGEEGNEWGGSGDIGGSPRKTGTGLSGREVLAVVARVISGNADA
jgi:hypothetical protein